MIALKHGFWLCLLVSGKSENLSFKNLHIDRWMISIFLERFSLSKSLFCWRLKPPPQKNFEIYSHYLPEIIISYLVNDLIIKHCNLILIAICFSSAYITHYTDTKHKCLNLARFWI